MFTKPRVVVSRCLGFDNCRYDGDIIRDEVVARLAAHCEYVTVCPEVEIGLGIPRKPIRISMDGERMILHQPSTGRDVTSDMSGFVESFLDSLEDIDGFILKNRSPSCGIADTKIYDSTDSKSGFRRGPGFFGGGVTEKFGGLAIEDEGRLKNFSLREHFLTKLFALSAFRAASASGKMKELVSFHSRYKLVLMAYNETHFRICGRIVANHEKLHFHEVTGLYREELKHILDKPPKYTSMINSLMHAFGWISKGLTPEEKRFVLDTIEEYRDERVPLSTVLHILKAHALRFNSEYLLGQVFLEPYPNDLVSISDSGKGRSY